jgi:FMN phosphatase YigB (HAD superfamily)
MTKCIIFDLGRVLVPFDFNRAWLTMETLSGLPTAEIRQRMADIGCFAEFEKGLITPEEFLARVCKSLDISMARDDFDELWNSIFLPHTLVREELLESLALRYRLVLLSNTNVIHFRFLRERYPLLRHFHGYVLSYEEGVMKPDPAIYRKAVAVAGCGAEACLFFDDIPENVEGAVAAGLPAVLFTSGAQLEEELRARGVI